MGMGKKTKVFICCNEKKKGRCGDNGGEVLKKNLKQLLKVQHLDLDFKIKSSGCLGKCSKGIACQLGDEKPIKNLDIQDGHLIIDLMKSYLAKKIVA